MLHATKGAGTQHARRRRRWLIVLPTALRKRRYNKFVFSCRRAASISKHLFRHAHKELETERREREREGGIEEDDPRLWLRLRLWLLRRRASVPPAKAVECGVCAICDQAALNYVVRQRGGREREGGEQTRLSLLGCVIYRQRRAAKWAFNLVCAATNRHSDRLREKKKSRTERERERKRERQGV